MVWCKKLVEEWCVDDFDDRDIIDGKGDRNIEYGKEVSVVNSVIKRVDDLEMIVGKSFIEF